MYRRLVLPAALLVAAFTPLAAQEPGSEVTPACPDIGVTNHHTAVTTASGFQACEWGMIEFHFGGAKIKWEDPVCPLFIFFEPYWTEIGEKHGTRILQVYLSRSMKFNYRCDEESENCTQVSIDEFGLYPVHIDTHCGEPPLITPPEAR
ncbi:MAG: hypothetical protein ISR76_10230 [Planctomycetes bacterium]|nr:hypothetical protein [Planctomycetota bacterium]MBL7009366.1 hypothetical protein [Planctomycetota bacterium]